MSNSTVQILARVLRVLLIFALLLNVLALLLVPASVMVNAENLFGGAGTFLHDLFHPEADDVTAAGVSAIFLSWVWIWGEGANALIALFLVICGICTALILLQGLRVLGTILQGAPFSTQNAVSLRRAAVCSFCIAGAALLRTIWGLWFYQSLRPLATYNALFVPIFTMFGLLCLVMSALFRQATEMKAENDLTIYPRHGSYCCPKNRGCVDFSLRFPHLLRHSAASPDTGPGLLPLSESGVHALRPPPGCFRLRL